MLLIYTPLFFCLSLSLFYFFKTLLFIDISFYPKKLNVHANSYLDVNIDCNTFFFFHFFLCSSLKPSKALILLL